MNMNKRIIFALVSLLALGAQALEVANTAGTLADRVTNMDITTLKVTGSMNADDFYFIANNLRRLTTVDLQNVKIEACHSAQHQYWQQDFAADEIPTCSFADMPVTSVTLPTGLKSIGKAAFVGCSRLASITLPSMLDSIGDYAFASCTSLKQVQLPARVEVVGCGAFMRCTSLTSFKVSSSSRLRRLDATALMDCPALTTISLGSSVQYVGERALAGTGIQNLDLSASNHLVSLGDWSMVMTPVTTAKMPSSLTHLGDGAFLYDGNLTQISLGGKINQLNDYLMAGTALNSAVDLNGITSIGDYALYNVSQLSVVELPETMTWLGTRAMAGMTGLEALTCMAADVPALGDKVWDGVNQSSIPLTVPRGSIDLYKSAAQWQKFLFESTWVRGDVNGDGEVNIADINALVNIILGHVYDDLFMQRADVNKDGEINISDINMVLAIITSSSFSPSQAVDTDDLLRLEDVHIQPGEQRTLTVQLDNSASYSSMQCDITLPQGLTLLNTAAAQGYVHETYVMDATTARAVTYSLTRPHFEGEETPVLTITVRADETLAGESDIVLSNIVIADSENTGWHLADCAARVSNSSGIEDLAAGADRVWVEGRTLCVETSRDGVARVAHINGIVRDMPVMAGVNRQVLEQGIYVVVINGKSHKIAIK